MPLLALTLLHTPYEEKMTSHLYLADEETGTERVRNLAQVTKPAAEPPKPQSSHSPVRPKGKETSTLLVSSPGICMFS